MVAILPLHQFVKVLHAGFASLCIQIFGENPSATKVLGPGHNI